MKLLALTALFIAGTLAVPTSSYPPPSPTPTPPAGYGDVGDGGDHGGDYGKDHGNHHPGYPKGDGDGHDNVPSSPGYHNGGSDEPPTNGDGHPSDGGDDGDGSYGGGDGGDGERDYSNLCPALLYSNPQCCSAGLLGILELECETPNRRPNSQHSFQEICAAQGRDAKCCAIPLAGLAVLCTDALSA